MRELKALGPGKVNSASLRDQAVKLIKNAILKGEIPPGEVISNEQLSAWLGISRTPIREALLELQKGGMVTIHRGKGTEIARLSRQDVIEIFEMREALEVKSCELAIVRMDQATLDALESIVRMQARDAERGDELAFLKSDHEFHLLLARRSGNGRLYNAIEGLREQFMLISTYALSKENRMQEVLGEHRDIMRALRSGDPALVRNVVLAHLQTTRADVLAVLPDLPTTQDAK